MRPMGTSVQWDIPMDGSIIGMSHGNYKLMGHPIVKQFHGMSHEMMTRSTIEVANFR